MNNDKFIRGYRAKFQFYDDFIVPQEIIDQVVKPFVVIGDEKTKYIIPQQEKSIKIITDEWKVEHDDGCNITISRPLTEREKNEFLNAINNREIYLEDVEVEE